MWLCWCILTCKRNYNNYCCRNDDAAKQADERDKDVTFKNCAPFTKCISRINYTGIDNAQDIDTVLPIITWLNIVIIIQKHLEVYINTTKMNPIII